MLVRTKFLAGVITGVLCGLLLFVLPVFGDPKPEERSEETLTVTARKIKEDVLKILVSVSLFTETQLKDARIENTLERIRYVPLFLLTAGGDNGVVFI